MKLDFVLAALRKVAPEHLAEGWDQVGLHLAGNGKQVRTAMLCIDLTPAVLDEAIAKKCQLIVAYHPPIFSPLTRLADRDWKERMLAKAIRSGLAVYSPHSSLDAVRNGMNDWLCDGLGAHAVRWAIGVPRVNQTHQFKVVVYVPRSHAKQVRKAMWEGGAGSISNYSECSFNIEGVGTFRGDAGTNPTIGQPGRLEHVEEVRIEVICWKDRLGDVIKHARKAHPYEQAAIDVLELQAEPEPEDEEQTPGRCQILRKPISAETLVRRVKRQLGMKRLKVAIPSIYGDEYPGQIGSLAVCVGSGGSLFEKYMTADAYITGEMQHHQVLDMVQEGKVVILAGHTRTERPFLKNYREALVAECDAVQWVVSTKDVAPLEIV